MSARLGKEIKAARARAGMSGRDLARAAGVTDSWIRQIETGRITKPAPQRLASVAEVLGLELQTMLAMTDQLGALVKPEPVEPDSADLASALHEIATELRALRQEREEREAMAARLHELEALVASLGEQVRSAPRTGAPRGRGLPLGTGE